MNPRALVRIPVGVLVERSKAQSPWADYTWRAIDVLPGGEDAAKDMGIWHVALVLPQILAPAITGLTLNALKSTSLLLGYTVVFILTAIWFVLGTVFVRQIRGAR